MLTAHADVAYKHAEQITACTKATLLQIYIHVYKYIYPYIHKYTYITVILVRSPIILMKENYYFSFFFFVSSFLLFSLHPVHSFYISLSLTLYIHITHRRFLVFFFFYIFQKENLTAGA